MIASAAALRPAHLVACVWGNTKGSVGSSECRASLVFTVPSRADEGETVTTSGLIANIEEARKNLGTIPVRGCITGEEEGRVLLQDQDGTWLIKRTDIVSTVEWQGCDPRIVGKPVLLFIREGAEVFELRRFKVQLQASPITLTNVASASRLKVKGGTITAADPGDTPAREFGYRSGTDPSAPRVALFDDLTISCATADDGFTCSGDDCGWH